MAEKRKTRKQLASDLGLNEKTMRSYLKVNGYFHTIAETLNDPEKSDAFENLFDQKSDNKKECISTLQLKALSMLSKADLGPLIDKILEYPQNAKQIIRNRIHTLEKVTITIDSMANDWFSFEAEKAGISKGKLLQQILLDYYDAHQDEW